jgi:anti-sigma factor RsiW
VAQRLLTCREAERAISHDLDGLLDDPGRSTLRAHLRACDPCERLASSQRAHQSALRALADVALPDALLSFDPDTRV